MKQSDHPPNNALFDFTLTWFSYLYLNALYISIYVTVNMYSHSGNECFHFLALSWYFNVSMYFSVITCIYISVQNKSNNIYIYIYIYIYIHIYIIR